MDKAKEFYKNICFIEYTKTFDYVDHNTVENSQRDGSTRPSCLFPEKPVCRLESDMEKWTGTNLGKDAARLFFCHPAY